MENNNYRYYREKVCDRKHTLSRDAFIKEIAISNNLSVDHATAVYDFFRKTLLKCLVAGKNVTIEDIGVMTITLLEGKYEEGEKYGVDYIEIPDRFRVRLKQSHPLNVWVDKLMKERKYETKERIFTW